MPYFRLISCEILKYECAALLTELPPGVRVDAEFLPKGLHDAECATRRETLAEAVRSADESGTYDAILLGYGLCSRGITGLFTTQTPLVAARAHDCITLFFGSRQRYSEYFFSHPATYFESVGWQEFGPELTQFSPDSFQAQCGVGDSLETFCEKYGPDNGPYLWKEFSRMTRNYDQLAFLRTNPPTDPECENCAKFKAGKEGWKFEALDGNLTLLRDLLTGTWDSERFLVLNPGEKIRESFDERIITAEQE